MYMYSATFNQCCFTLRSKTFFNLSLFPLSAICNAFWSVTFCNFQSMLFYTSFENLLVFHFSLFPLHLPPWTFHLPHFPFLETANEMINKKHIIPFMLKASTLVSNFVRHRAFLHPSPFHPFTFHLSPFTFHLSPFTFSFSLDSKWNDQSTYNTFAA